MIQIDEITQPCTNFRDITLLQHNIAGKGVLFRSGHLRNICTREDVLCEFKTIVNFCPEPDCLGSQNLPTRSKLVHIPFEGPDKDVYNSAESMYIRHWISRVVDSIGAALQRGEYPVLFHCFSGKDRTGIIAATLLAIAECNKDDIFADYCVSDGKLYKESMQSYLSHITRDIFPLLSPEHMDCIRNALQRPHDRKVLRIGYLPRQRSFHHNDFHWMTDSCGRLSSLHAALVFDFRVVHDHHVRYFLEEDVTHTKCIQNAILNRHISDRWVPLIPMPLGGISGRFNEAIMSKSGIRELGSFYRRIGRKSLSSASELQSTSESKATTCSQFALIKVPICIVLRYSTSDNHGVQRPDFLIISSVGHSPDRHEGEELIDLSRLQASFKWEYGIRGEDSCIEWVEMSGRSSAVSREDGVIYISNCGDAA